MKVRPRGVCQVAAAILAGVTVFPAFSNPAPVGSFAGFFVAARLFVTVATALTNEVPQPARLDYLMGMVGLPGAALCGVLAAYIAFVRLADGDARRAR
jgi:hypothetical protein